MSPMFTHSSGSSDMRKIYSLKDNPHLWTDGISIFTSRPTDSHDLLDPYGVATFDDRRPEDRERSRKITVVSDKEDIECLDNAWSRYRSSIKDILSCSPTDTTEAKKEEIKRPEAIDPDAIDGVPESEMVEL